MIYRIHILIVHDLIMNAIKGYERIFKERESNKRDDKRR